MTASPNACASITRDDIAGLTLRATNSDKSRQPVQLRGGGSASQASRKGLGQSDRARPPSRFQVSPATPARTISARARASRCCTAVAVLVPPWRRPRRCQAAASATRRHPGPGPTESFLLQFCRGLFESGLSTRPGSEYPLAFRV